MNIERVLSNIVNVTFCDWVENKTHYVEVSAVRSTGPWGKEVFVKHNWKFIRPLREDDPLWSQSEDIENEFEWFGGVVFGVCGDSQDTIMNLDPQDNYLYMPAFMMKKQKDPKEPEQVAAFSLYISRKAGGNENEFLPSWKVTLVPTEKLSLVAPPEGVRVRRPLPEDRIVRDECLGEHNIWMKDDKGDHDVS